MRSDGREHAHTELYHDLDIMVHSRAADLRKRGHDVRCRREGNLSLYRLVAPPACSPATPFDDGAGTREHVHRESERAGGGASGYPLGDEAGPVAAPVASSPSGSLKPAASQRTGRAEKPPTEPPAADPLDSSDPAPPLSQARESADDGALGAAAPAGSELAVLAAFRDEFGVDVLEPEQLSLTGALA